MRLTPRAVNLRRTSNRVHVEHPPVPEPRQRLVNPDRHHVPLDVRDTRVIVSAVFPTSDQGAVFANHYAIGYHRRIIQEVTDAGFP